MQFRRKWVIPSVVVIALAAIAVFGFRGAGQLQYFTAKVERGEVRDAVDATGTVNAVITVQVGSQVSGTIAKLNADFNSRVHKGDVIAEIEPSLLQGALLQADADRDNAKANVVAAEANLEKANAMLGQTKGAYDRTVSLVGQRIETQENLEIAKANYDAATATVHAAAAAITQAKAQVTQREAAVTIAKTNLNNSVIRSPIDGIVVARNVDVGQTVAASLQAPTIFTIAQDLAKMRVYAKVDESDVGRIKIKQEVIFKVDAFPADTFRGLVSQVRMNATTVQNVVTYDAVIEFDNPQLRLFPGMTAYVTIPVSTAENAIKIPNAALRYRPPLSTDEIRVLYTKYGIDDGKQPPAAKKDAATIEMRGQHAVVWTLHADHTLEPVKLSLGVTDHAFTEVKAVLNGHLQPGDPVITASLVSKTPPAPGQPVRR
jgi:HlyD family secretion protein